MFPSRFEPLRDYFKYLGVEFGPLRVSFQPLIVDLWPLGVNIMVFKIRLLGSYFRPLRILLLYMSVLGL